MTMQGKIADMKLTTEQATGAPQNLALSICRRPIVSETVSRVLGRMPAFALRNAPESIAALSTETEARIGEAALVVFELDAATVADSDAILRLVEHGGAKTRFLAVTGDDLPLSQARALMKLGIDDVVPTGEDADELAETLSGALREVLTAAAPPAPVAKGGGAPRRAGTVIAVTRGRGGLGATTIAVNLADMLLEPHGLLVKANTHTVALVDLDIQFGNAGTYLDLEDNGAMVEIARSPNVPDRAFLDTAMQRQQSGLRVLTAPKAAIPLEAIDEAKVAAILESLREDFDYVVVDLPRALVPWLEAVMRRTDLLLMVCDTSVPAVSASRRLLDLLTDEVPGLMTEVVINRERRPLVLSHAHKLAADALRLPLKHFVADDAAAARRAVDRGEVLNAVSPNSSLTKSLKRVAGSILNTFPARTGAGRSHGSN